MAKKAVKIQRSALREAGDEMEIKMTKKGRPISNEALLALIEENMDDHADEDGRFENEVLAEIANARDTGRDIEVVGEDPSEPKKPAAKGKGKGKKAEPVEEVEVDEDDEDDEEAEDEEEEAPPAKAKGKAKKAAAPAKAKGKAKKPTPVEEDEDDEEDEEEAPAKGKGKSKKATKKPAKAEKEAKPKANTDKWGSREGSSAFRINQVLFRAKKGLTSAQIHEKVSADDDSISKDRVNAHLRRLHIVSELLERDEKGRYTVAAE